MRVFEYRLRPNRKQEAALQGVLNASRRLYNLCLEELVAHYRETGKYLHIYEQDKKHGKTEHPDLPAVVVDTTLKRVHRSFANFFRGCREGKRIGFPRFKSWKRWSTFEFRDAQNCLDGKYFKAGRVCGGRIRVVLHRPLDGTFRFARIVKRPSGWYLQCMCDTELKPLPPMEGAVGLDMGITYLVADSDGGFIRNPNAFHKSAKKLAKAQKRLARCQKGSHRREKARQRVARIHERIGNQRKDALHKISRRYVNVYQTIVIEDLKPVNMVCNHSLALSISDSSWGMLRHMLTYKAADAGRELVAVPPHYTSQKCSRCGAYVQKSLGVRTHVCPGCGYVADRDTNAARNILQARTGPSLRVGEGP